MATTRLPACSQDADTEPFVPAICPVEPLTSTRPFVPPTPQPPTLPLTPTHSLSPIPSHPVSPGPTCTSLLPSSLRRELHLPTSLLPAPPYLLPAHIWWQWDQCDHM